MKKFLILIPLVLLGCAREGESPSDIGQVNYKNPNVIDTPNGFGSVAFVCHGTTGLYITADDTRATSAIAVVQYHDKCYKE